jgi:hypothetical protein
MISCRSIVWIDGGASNAFDEQFLIYIFVTTMDLKRLTLIHKDLD